MLNPLHLTGSSLGLFVVCVVMLATSFILVSLRVFVRVFMIRAFGWDDVMMVIGMALYFAFCISFAGGSVNGIGHHIDEFPSDLKLYGDALLWWWCGQIFYVWSASFTKLSIATALLRLTITKTHRWILWSMIAIVISSGFAFFLVFLLYCSPVSHFWQRVNPEIAGHCLAPSAIVQSAYVFSTTTIITDATLAILPGFLIWNLKMSTRTKIALLGVLSLGALASVAVLVRFPLLHHYKDPDFLHSALPIGMCAIIETGIGIIAGCLIALRPLFRWFLDRSRAYSNSKQYQKSGSRNYALSHLKKTKGDTTISHASGWMPERDEEAYVTTVTVPNHNSYGSGDSQEYLDPLHKVNQVKIQETFQVVTERRQDSP